MTLFFMSSITEVCKCLKTTEKTFLNTEINAKNGTGRKSAIIKTDLTKHFPVIFALNTNKIWLHFKTIQSTMPWFSWLNKCKNPFEKSKIHWMLLLIYLKHFI